MAIKVSELQDFDPAEYLESEQAMAEYLTAIIEENNPALLAAALGDIARASGITREALYKALKPDAHSRFDTIARVCTALGLKLSVAPA